MTTETTPLDVRASDLEALDLGAFDVPLVDLDDAPYVHSSIVLDGTEYAYSRSFPVKGHSAVMPQAVAELQAQGKQVLVGERGERYLIYVA
jgi:hypothetical protein